MKPPPTHSLESESGAPRPPIDELVDLPGGWLSEGSLLPVVPRRIEPDELANFPSEVVALPTVLDEPARIRVVSPVVEPSDADRQRVFPQPVPLKVPARRLSDAFSLATGVLAFGSIGAAIVLGLSRPAPIPSSARSVSEASVTALAPPPPAATPAATPASTPISSTARSTASAPTATAPPTRRDISVATRSAPAPRTNLPKAPALSIKPTPFPITNISSAPTWQLASTSTTIAPPPPIPTPAYEPPAPPAPTVTPTATASPTIPKPTPTATPAAPAPETAARAARTASIQSVLDRYRTAFNSLDAKAVEGFWPSADVHALNRAFGQLDSQRFQFDHCDIELAGARAFASCRGSAEYVKKAGSREPRHESREWTFTFGEAGSGWVILRVDARQAQ